MELDKDSELYKSVHISARITSRANQLLSEAAKRSGRTKTQEAKIRLHDHLERYRCISELNVVEKK